MLELWEQKISRVWGLKTKILFLYLLLCIPKYIIFLKMYKQKHILVTLLFLIFFVSESFSQIIVTPTSGCAPLSVTFSGPAGASAVFWNLGSGTGTSTLSSPNPLYTNPGTYNITYTAIVGGSPVTSNTTIVVSQGPSANFSAVIPASHCAPMTVNFTASGGGQGSIYTWAFGDLSPLVTGSSLTHTYTFANNFIPIVTVYDPVTTCSALATSNAGTIHVSTKPSTLIISSNGFVGCTPPFTTSIDGSGSISGSPITGGGLTYNWGFTGGTPAASSATVPGVVTFGAGVHVINLLVVDNNQCSNSGTVAVTVITPTLSATIPGTVCINGATPATVQTTQSNVTFNAQSLGQYNFATVPNVSLTIDTVCIFTAPGIHTINVSVQGNSGCPPVSVLKTVFVEQVSPNFTLVPPHSSCSRSMVTSYINLSTNNTGSSMSYTWSADFPPNSSHSVNGTPAAFNNMSSPSFTFYQGSANPYTIYNYFMPNITLIAQSNSIAHCFANVVYYEYDTLVRPSAVFNVSTRGGCAPLAVQYMDSSFTSPTYPILSYTWCNGAVPPSFFTGNAVAVPNSTPAITKIPPHTFTYANPGTYYPYLIINTLMGCLDTSFVDTITVVNPPTVSATFPSTACAGAPVTITLTGSGSNVPSSSGIDHWHVNTDRQFFSGCITNSSPTFSFTHVGTHPVIVSAYQANCGNTSMLVPTIQIKGPYGKFQFENTCVGNKFSVKFNVHLQEVSTATLYFGDGSNQILNGNATANIGLLQNHVYATTGNFMVTLSTENSLTGCSHSFSRQVKIRDPKAKITFAGQPIPGLPNALACVGTKYKFDAYSTTEERATCGRGYVWNFQVPGTPGYTLHPLELAIPIFSTQYYPTGLPDPDLDTAFYFVDRIALDTFRVAGIYTISLMVTDDNGCQDTETKTFRISEVVPEFTFATNPVCKTSQPVQIYNTTQSNQISPDVVNNYQWSYGDGSISTSTNPADSPAHTYSSVASPSQIFTVVCSATNAPIGCKGRTTHTIQVNNPIPGFSADNPFPCVPKFQTGLVNFTANQGYSTYSVNYGVLPAWANFNGSLNGAVFNYGAPGTYVSTLTVTDAAGCKATETLAIHAIGQPTAHIKFKDDIKDFCKVGLPKIYSEPDTNITSVSDHLWTVLNVQMLPPGSYSIEPVFPLGQHFISLTVYADNRCPSTATDIVNVYDPMATAFAVDNKTTVCLGDPIKVSIKNFNEVSSWKWFFGDNVTQPLIYAAAPNGTMNPTKSYPYLIFPTTGSNGFTTINLLYYPPGNACEEVSSFSIHVIKIEADFKNEIDKYSHCLTVADNFSNTTLNPTNQNFITSWNFGDGTIVNGQFNSSSHTFTQAGVYNVELTVKDSDYGCINTAIKQMTIFPNPTAAIVATPTLNCPNASFTISGNGQPGVSGTLTGTLASAASNQSLNLAPSNTFTTQTSTSITTVFSLTVEDDNNCKSEPAFTTVKIIPPAPTVRWDTTVIIGQLTPLNAYAGEGFTYTWTPVTTNLDCDTCLIANPISNTTLSITYTVEVEDDYHCSIVKNTYQVFILPKISLDVPTAFTPNGDGINDVIYPSGWGIRNLNYFKVFNRWGQLIFESNDIKIGWDGMFQGVPQNMETYVYQVSVNTLLGSEPILTKTGTFKLIR
jgi:gliding motility-associated-like protein